ncbi:alpha/beta hydrolase fold domain-containing protein [Actinomadura algeriensis]|uniref:Acetyl esterase/lipase n=1 Tax=Actinomadura algeriensis TaxID=1679523 RepID=A0ABR9JU66_9ACTN|nr:alpha/beta hydrolase fold domain-containing protein [Actinomadura algeriensis]MBE1534110.1 acetyl esterase/lipase [Actinomadura algeriensis]
MRKAVVFSAALAATCASAVAVPMTAQAAAPGPTATPAPTTSAPDTGTDAPTGTPSAPTEPTGAPTAPRDVPSGAADGTVSATAVMVTPELPKNATYSYGPGALQQVDAYWTDDGRGTAPRPAVLIVHGGYWLQGDKSAWEYFARRLVADGYVVLSANYRLAPAAQWPAQRTDVLSALNFLKTNAARWNADPERVVVLGSSSGGHLATQLGTYGDGGERVRGVIALSPPNDPELAYTDGAAPTANHQQRKLRRAVVELLGCDPAEAVAGSRCWKLLEDAKPATHADAADAPMLVMHGTSEFVPVTESRGLATALRAAGIEATIKTIEGSSHAAALLDHPDTYPMIAEWLDEHLAPATSGDGGTGTGREDDEGGEHETPGDLPGALPTQRSDD